MNYANDRKTEFTKKELLDILNSFLTYKPIFEKHFKDVNRPSLDSFPISDVTHKYIGYDYTYVEAAWKIQGLVSKHGLLDINYLSNADKICEKYDVSEIEEAYDKLDFLEVMTVFTLIARADRHCDGCVYEAEVENGTFYKLLCRLEEIKNEL